MQMLGEATFSELTKLLVTQIWQISLLILLVTLLARYLGRRRPHLVHLLWLIVFVKCLTPPVLTHPFSLFGWLQPAALVPGLAAQPDPAVATKPGGAAFVEQQVANRPSAGVPVADQPVNATLAEPADSLSPPFDRGSIASGTAWLFIPWHHLLMGGFCGLWLVGIGLLTVRAMRHWLRVRRSIAAASAADDWPELVNEIQQLKLLLKLRRPVDLVVSSENLGPLVLGIFRLRLVLPLSLVESKTPQALRPIIAHELLHARRGDTLFTVLQFAARVIWWFHPLVILASREANRVCEQCCDEEVIANLGCAPASYANCLLDSLELRQLTHAPAVPGIRSVDITTQRLENIMRNADRFRPFTPRRYWLAAAVLSLMVLPGGTPLLQAWQDRQTSGPTATPQDGSNSNSELATLKQEAQQAIAQKDWQTASQKLRAVVEQEATNGRAWFMLGYSLHALGRMDEAVQAHQQATTFPGVAPTAHYNLACAQAIQGKTQAALASLQKAIDGGFISQTPIEQDPDLKSLLEAPQFLTLAEQTKPPAQRAVYRQFDFLVGQWDVFGRNGQQVGTNVITRDEKGFLLVEKWTNSSGSTGTSINYFDPSDKQWKQTWVDQGGNVVQYRGSFHDGKMQLTGELKKPDGQITQSRVSYTLNDDGTVRQLIEHSRDQGGTWSVYFDGKYVRRVEPSDKPA